jgi:hypothetical protein
MGEHKTLSSGNGAEDWMELVLAVLAVTATAAVAPSD